MAKAKNRDKRKKRKAASKPGEWEAKFTGRLVMCLNADTLQEMKDRSRFEGHWRTRTAAIIKHRRMYRINIYVYDTQGDWEHDIAQLEECGSMEELWHIIKKIVDGVIAENPDKEIDHDRTIATVKA